MDDSATSAGSGVMAACARSAAADIGFAAHRPIDAGEPLAEGGGRFVAAPHALTSWAIAAGPGRVCIYARADRLPRGGVGERARQLHAQGLIRLRGQRRTDGGLLEYLAERTGLSFAAAKAVPDEAGLSPDGRMLLDLLVALADAGERCPCDRALSAMLGFKHGHRAGTLMSELRTRGLIETRSLAASAPGAMPEKLRVVRIRETGAETWAPEGCER
ncbi:hypothetical protein [Stakelama tenebrarum]|uniref:Uncharacterized protein n=1 Tax=Stakelama tenebrarum TaxID=2711215 RepID=A0A6G6Y4Z6_9SPHN|nr:hypothetical protein [Sphingosinithalassobacter tenebrarum]QIG79969.1 hypothetical protein G5C33_09405 [Sphingosinithalassobacter tenebrarum]